MELFTIEPDTFEAELERYDLRIREVIRAYPPNCSYMIKGADKRANLSCGIIIGYGITEPKIIGAPGIPVVTMAFLIKPVRSKGGFALTQTLVDVPASRLHETTDTPELWYERTYKMRHPCTWMDLLRVGTKQMVMAQEGAVKRTRVADVEAVDAEASKES